MRRDIYQMESTAGLDSLIHQLSRQGYEVIAPIQRDRTIMLAKIDSVNDLPRGMTDKQEKGSYRLNHIPGDQSFFRYNLGPDSWKGYLFPKRKQLWTLKRNQEPLELALSTHSFAFLGMRACELSAIRVQDKVFLGPTVDPDYKRRRADNFIIAVHCRTAAATCFCPSMGTGPEFPSQGWDLLLTEVEDKLLVEAGSDKGEDILSYLPLHRPPVNAEAVISEQLSQTRQLIKRTMDQSEIKESIYQSISSYNWEDVGSRCLACANCTLVCPTCFCSTVEDISDLEGETAERWQRWDSCFHLDFSYTHGGSRRVTNASRYRQWFTHKLASWYDQFGSSGCVGCGRCIAWCPVGIDITEEMRAIRSAAEEDSQETK